MPPGFAISLGVPAHQTSPLNGLDAKLPTNGIDGVVQGALPGPPAVFEQVTLCAGLESKAGRSRTQKPNGQHLD